MSKKGNLLLVANWESNVGYAWWLMENFWVTISKHFSEKEMLCFLQYPKITKIPDSISDSDIIVSECDFYNRSLTNIKKIHSFVKSNNIRFLYLSDAPDYSFFYLLLRFWGIKKIVIHDHSPGERTPPASMTRLAKTCIQSIPYFTADHFIAVTDYVYDRFINVNCIPESKCSVAHNGIKPINLDSVDSKYAYNVFNIPEDRILVATTGRATYYKGINFFIECGNELVNNRGIDTLHFLYCGDGPNIDEFQSLVKRLDMEQHFTFAGRRQDIARILPSCHIGFHAAIGEVGYSLSILEYMSAGLATIVPDNPSTCAATQHMITGLRYSHGNIESACEAITQCLDTELRKRLASNAIKDINDHYNIKDTNIKLISILSDVYS